MTFEKYWAMTVLDVPCLHCRARAGETCVAHPMVCMTRLRSWQDRKAAAREQGPRDDAKGPTMKEIADAIKDGSFYDLLTPQRSCMMHADCDREKGGCAAPPPVPPAPEHMTTPAMKPESRPTYKEPESSPNWVAEGELVETQTAMPLEDSLVMRGKDPDAVTDAEPVHGGGDARARAHVLLGCNVYDCTEKVHPSTVTEEQCRRIVAALEAADAREAELRQRLLDTTPTASQETWRAHANTVAAERDAIRAANTALTAELANEREVTRSVAERSLVLAKEANEADERVAALAGRLEDAERLLREGIDPDVTNEWGDDVQAWLADCRAYLASRDGGK